MNYRDFALKQARLNIVHQQQLAKLRFDKNRSHPNFQLGDLVWMKPFGTQANLMPDIPVLSKIVQILSPVSFIIKDQNSQQLPVHSNNLKRVYPRWQTTFLNLYILARPLCIFLSVLQLAYTHLHIHSKQSFFLLTFAAYIYIHHLSLLHIVLQHRFHGNGYLYYLLFIYHDCSCYSVFGSSISSLF